MSGVGFSELIILFLIGLIVLGPERLPRVANQLGTWLGQARRMTRVMKRQLEEELQLEEKNRIRPAPSVNRPSYVTPANEADDTYSPAHAPGAAGTGVGTDTAADNTSDEAAAERQRLDDDVASALPESAKADADKAP